MYDSHLSPLYPTTIETCVRSKQYICVYIYVRTYTDIYRYIIYR